MLKKLALAAGSLVAVAAAFLPVTPASTQDAAPQYDVLIRNGQVIDGSGEARRVADVAIKGDRIAAVGSIPANAKATTTIDATGKFVTPGFIDPHSHAAPGVATAELAAAMPILYQGVTTVFINPDGGGPADLAPQLQALRELVPGVNVAPLIGHNAVREAAMGNVNRDPTPAEMNRMEGLVREAMKLGAFGLSSGPFYVPGKYSKTPEIVRLAQVAGEFPQAFYTSHIRDEASYGIGVLAAINEVIEIARQAKIPGIVSHMKMLGPSVWGKSADAIRMIDAARAEGVQVWADQYAYAASGSSLQSALVPGWAQEGGPEAMAKRLQDPSLRPRIRQEMEKNLERRAGANALMIREYLPDPSLHGKRLDEIARMRGEHPLDAAINLMIKGNVRTISFNMNEADVEAIMKQPWTMTSSDGGLVRFGRGSEHPRAYGAFPRKIRHYVLDRNVVSLEKAIYAATGLSAKVLGVTDRGLLRPGGFADVLVFDPAKIRDVATFEKPHAYAEGMVHVFVNGKAAIADGKVLPVRRGRLLLRAKVKAS